MLNPLGSPPTLRHSPVFLCSRGSSLRQYNFLFLDSFWYLFIYCLFTDTSPEQSCFSQNRPNYSAFIISLIYIRKHFDCTAVGAVSGGRALSNLWFNINKLKPKCFGKMSIFSLLNFHIQVFLTSLVQINFGWWDSV